jgi:hypothetical protein
MMPKIAIAGMQAVSDLLFPGGIVKKIHVCYRLDI